MRLDAETPKPKPLAVEDTFYGQFDRSVRYPGLDETLASLGSAIDEFSSSGEEFFSHMPGYGEYTAAARKFMEANLRLPHLPRPRQGHIRSR